MKTIQDFKDAHTDAKGNIVPNATLEELAEVDTFLGLRRRCGIRYKVKCTSCNKGNLTCVFWNRSSCTNCFAGRGKCEGNELDEDVEADVKEHGKDYERLPVLRYYTVRELRPYLRPVDREKLNALGGGW